jgi:soluble lytic murein transglycosylase
MVGALEFVERSLTQSETAAAKERRRSLELLLKKDRVSDSGPTVGYEVLAEDDFEVRFRESEQKQDWVNLMRDLVEYLKTYPSGKKAAWADERVRSLLVRFGPNTSKDQSLMRVREKLIERTKKADPVRLAEWARVFHRRADYLVSLNLSSAALGFYENTSVAAELLWICGRSAQFLGSYRQSRTCFEALIESHRGSSYFHEALFRLGLVHYRQKQWSSARAQFEALLAENSERYELNTRYWLVRVGQKLNSNELEEKHREVILANYPLSYYGLRLRLEQTPDSRLVNVIPETGGKSVTSEFTWTDRERGQLSKVAVLAQNGWHNEALREFEGLTWPRSLENKIVMIPQLARLGLYFPVIRLTNEVTDLDPAYRSVNLLQKSYPQVFVELVRREAEARRMSPFLVRSLIRQESGFRTDIASSSDARGLMQMIPPTGDEVAADLGARDVLIPEDLSRPSVNIQFGTYYLAQMLNRFSRNVPAALAAYNAGPTRVELFFQARAELQHALTDPSSSADQEIWFDEIPWSETSFYIKAILRNSFLFQWLETNPAAGGTRELKLPALLWSNLLLPPES